MSKTKSQLRYGLWPDSPTPTHLPPPQLTGPARRLAESAIEDLSKFGVVATLDGDGRARFRATRFTPPAAKLAIERHGDLIQAFLRERAARLPQP